MENVCQMRVIDSCNIVYISYRCAYCKALLQGVQDNPGVRYVNVDCTKREALPRCVDRVPMMTTTDGRVVADADLFRYLGVTSTGQSESGDACPDKSDDIRPFDRAGPDASDSGGYWMVDEHHDGINTPECQEMPAPKTGGSVRSDQPVKSVV